MTTFRVLDIPENILVSYNYLAKQSGVRDEFRSGGLKSLARMFFVHYLHVNQGVLPEYYLIFCPENGCFKNSRGAAAPLNPNGPYAYESNAQEHNIYLQKTAR